MKKSPGAAFSRFEAVENIGLNLEHGVDIWYSKRSKFLFAASTATTARFEYYNKKRSEQ